MNMAKYLILIYGDEREWDAMTPEQVGRHHAAHRAFSEAAGSAMLGGAQLESSSVATSLRMNPAGGYTTTDGPFLETKEALGGYYVIEAPDLDAAVTLAARLPEVAAGHSGVEIRPIVGM
jgi:hypothetical protein